jgi:hypothetical protein
MPTALHPKHHSFFAFTVNFVLKREHRAHADGKDSFVLSAQVGSTNHHQIQYTPNPH